jgi:hypothetical protein
MGDPTSSYATTGIALRVSGALKPNHHDKAETPSVGMKSTNYGNPEVAVFHIVVLLPHIVSVVCSQTPVIHVVCSK